MSKACDFHRELIQSLLQPAVWPGSVTEVQHIETHISTVLLTGDYAYKIKKPINLGFLDFSTLERRKYFCEEEIRLNSRLAPQIYQNVVPITGSVEQPVIAGDGQVIEYAVRMNQFEPDALLSNHLELLTVEWMDKLAQLVADFHGRIAMADLSQPFGKVQNVFSPIEDNFVQIRKLLDLPGDKRQLDQLECWAKEQLVLLSNPLVARRTEGHIRECHGDMHLGNIALVNDELLIFDGIEFSPALRWIDTMSEIAFLIMDLQEKKQADLAQRFLNSYLTITGDYEGLMVLRFYQFYRAMVRAKVNVIRLQQSGLSLDEQEAAQIDCRVYLAQAKDYTCKTEPALIITHGLSGSGKSTAIMELLGELSAIQIRSDVERKRLIVANTKSASALYQGIYHPEATENTYNHLKKLATNIIKAGYVAIVDATFLMHCHRCSFHELAQQLGVSFLILDFEASEEILRKRIDQRLIEGSDPSEANQDVLDAQLINQEPLTVSEETLSIKVTPEKRVDSREIREYLTRQVTTSKD